MICQISSCIGLQIPISGVSIISFTAFIPFQGILTTLSQSNGKYKYDYATVPFLAEVFKVLHIAISKLGMCYVAELSSLVVWFCISEMILISINLQLLVSSCFLWRECQKSPLPKMTTDWKTIRLFPIPSIIYLIHNNVQFATLIYVDTSTYQIMGNLKIVTTGILFRLLLLHLFQINFFPCFWCWCKCVQTVKIVYFSFLFQAVP